MSMLPTGGIVVSAAGLPLAQTSGSDLERTQQATTAQARRRESQIRAEETAGIAQTDGEDQETNDRDADGRRPWEFPKARRQQGDSFESSSAAANADSAAGQSDVAPSDAELAHLNEPPAESGGHLDLTG